MAEFTAVCSLQVNRSKYESRTPPLRVNSRTRCRGHLPTRVEGSSQRDARREPTPTIPAIARLRSSQ